MLIYKITNKINQKIYIGETTVGLKERWSNYVRAYKWIKPGDSGQRPIVRAMQKYGIENFTIEIIHDDIQTQKELDDLEVYYIKQYKSQDPEIGYNIENGGNGNGKHSEATKQKISKAQIGEKNHMWGKKGKDNPTSKPIIDLISGQIYPGILEYCRIHNIKGFSAVAACARGESLTNHNTIVRYIDKNNNPIYVKPPTKIIKTVEIIEETSNTICKNIKEACKMFSVSETVIKNSIKKDAFTKYKLKFKVGNINEIEVLTHNPLRDKVLPEYQYLLNWTSTQ